MRGGWCSGIRNNSVKYSVERASYLTVSTEVPNLPELPYRYTSQVQDQNDSARERKVTRFVL